MADDDTEKTLPRDPTTGEPILLKAEFDIDTYANARMVGILCKVINSELSAVLCATADSCGVCHVHGRYFVHLVQREEWIHLVVLLLTPGMKLILLNSTLRMHYYYYSPYSFLQQNKSRLSIQDSSHWNAL